MKRRKTPAKEAILSALSRSTRAMSQDALERKLEIAVDRSTIYRVLNRFCEDGVLHRIVAEDGKQYFALCAPCEDPQPPLHHFHFRCTSCETIQCLPVPVHFSLPGGYRVEQVNCVLTGICRECG